MNHNRAGRQRGGALIMSLVLLVVITLLAVTSIRTSSLNLRSAHNMQLQQEAESAAQVVIEQVLSNLVWFTTPQAQFTVADNVIPGHETYGFFVDNRRCLDATPRAGDQLDTGADFGERADGTDSFAAGVDNTIWEVRAGVEDVATGARAVIRQGVAIQMLTGSCD